MVTRRLSALYGRRDIEFFKSLKAIFINPFDRRLLPMYRVMASWYSIGLSMAALFICVGPMLHIIMTTVLLNAREHLPSEGKVLLLLGDGVLDKLDFNTKFVYLLMAPHLSLIPLILSIAYATMSSYNVPWRKKRIVLAAVYMGNLIASSIEVSGTTLPPGTITGINAFTSLFLSIFMCVGEIPGELMTPARLKEAKRQMLSLFIPLMLVMGILFELYIHQSAQLQTEYSFIVRAAIRLFVHPAVLFIMVFFSKMVIARSPGAPLETRAFVVLPTVCSLLALGRLLIAAAGTGDEVAFLSFLVACLEVISRISSVWFISKFKRSNRFPELMIHEEKVLRTKDIPHNALPLELIGTRKGDLMTMELSNLQKRYEHRKSTTLTQQLRAPTDSASTPIEGGVGSVTAAGAISTETGAKTGHGDPGSLPPFSEDDSGILGSSSQASFEAEAGVLSWDLFRKNYSRVNVGGSTPLARRALSPEPSWTSGSPRDAIKSKRNESFGMKGVMRDGGGTASPAFPVPPSHLTKVFSHGATTFGEGSVPSSSTPGGSLFSDFAAPAPQDTKGTKTSFSGTSSVTLESDGEEGWDASEKVGCGKYPWGNSEPPTSLPFLAVERPAASAPSVSLYDLSSTRDNEGNPGGVLSKGNDTDMVEIMGDHVLGTNVSVSDSTDNLLSSAQSHREPMVASDVEMATRSQAAIHLECDGLPESAEQDRRESLEHWAKQVAMNEHRRRVALISLMPSLLVPELIMEVLTIVSSEVMVNTMDEGAYSTALYTIIPRVLLALALEFVVDYVVLIWAQFGARLDFLGTWKHFRSPNVVQAFVAVGMSAALYLWWAVLNRMTCYSFSEDTEDIQIFFCR